MIVKWEAIEITEDFFARLAFRASKSRGDNYLLRKCENDFRKDGGKAKSGNLIMSGD